MNGIFTALLTPFNTDYSINLDSLKNLVEFNIRSGINGFYVGGSTGEAMLMTQDERKLVLKAVKDFAGDRVKLIAHTGSTATDFAVDLALYAKKLGYDAVSAVAPYYYSHTLQAVKQYYYDIAAASDMPLFIYNFPGGSGFGLTTETAAEMFEADDRITGIKHTSTDLFMLRQIKERIPRAVVFNGFDEICLAGLSMGADGAIGSTYNFMGAKFVSLYEAFRSGNIEKAQKLQNEACSIIAVMCRYGVFQCEKEILTQMGIEMGQCRRPFLPLSPEGKKAVSEILHLI
ncbi:MAG: N-acetylneuraminate lyase [Clostridia bacterium]|nr:N-acetylneuraminate lyase [Clostridia bacterium]